MADRYSERITRAIAVRHDLWEVFERLRGRVDYEFESRGADTDDPKVWVKAADDSVTLCRPSFEEAVSELERLGLTYDYAFTILTAADGSRFELYGWSTAPQRLMVAATSASASEAKGLVKLADDFLSPFEAASLAPRAPWWQRAWVWVTAAVGAVCAYFLAPVVANVVSDAVSRWMFPGG